MLQYAICEINKKQYKVIPNKELLLNLLDQGKKEVEVNVLLLVEEGKVKIGNPYLKEKLTLRVMDVVRGSKVRVSKFHAKANYRKTSGFRPKLTKAILNVKKA